MDQTLTASSENGGTFKEAMLPVEPVCLPQDSQGILRTLLTLSAISTIGYTDEYLRAFDSKPTHQYCELAAGKAGRTGRYHRAAQCSKQCHRFPTTCQPSASGAAFLSARKCYCACFLPASLKGSPSSLQSKDGTLIPGADYCRIQLVVKVHPQNNVKVRQSLVAQHSKRHCMI